jgi:PAS domain S-box-containing protein
VLRSKVAVFLDLHDKTEALRLSEERLRLLVEHVEDHAVIWCDADARVATWNAGAERVTGLREAEILGEPFARLYPPGSSGRHDPAGHLAIARARGMWHEPEGLRTRADGRFYWASTTVTAVQGSGGELVGYSVLVQDVTERRRTDIALRTRAEALEQINHDLEQFVAVVSEDLGEPLESIAGSVRELQALGQRLEDGARQLVDGIGAETDGMRARVEDLLRYSRVAQDELQRTSVDCAAVVERALAQLAEQGRSADASIDVGPLPTVDADEELLSLVFTNLLDNALRYADPELGARVAVHAEADGGLWLFRVSDEGIGLDYGDVERVFELFERVHPDAYPGSGIGLTICRRIVERHGGRIWAEPQPEGGTSFVFTLPTAELA